MLIDYHPPRPAQRDELETGGLGFQIGLLVVFVITTFLMWNFVFEMQGDSPVVDVTVQQPLE